MNSTKESSSPVNWTAPPVSKSTKLFESFRPCQRPVLGGGLFSDRLLHVCQEMVSKFYEVGHHRFFREHRLTQFTYNNKNDCGEQNNETPVSLQKTDVFLLTLHYSTAPKGPVPQPIA